jgi:hypothetical protein
MELNEKTTFDELVPTDSKYLKKDDVGEEGVNLTIAGFKRETLKGDNGDEEKTIMGFVESEDYKPMVLNKTNSQLIPIVTGAATPGEARGKKVNVFNDPTISFGAKITGGLRIRKPQGVKEDDNPLDDSIPF